MSMAIKSKCVFNAMDNIQEKHPYLSKKDCLDMSVSWCEKRQSDFSNGIEFDCQEYQDMVHPIAEEIVYLRATIDHCEWIIQDVEDFIQDTWYGETEKHRQAALKGKKKETPNEVAIRELKEERAIYKEKYSEKIECEKCKGKGKLLRGKTRETAKLVECRECQGKGIYRKWSFPAMTKKEYIRAGKIERESGRHWQGRGGLAKPQNWKSSSGSTKNKNDLIVQDSARKKKTNTQAMEEGKAKKKASTEPAREAKKAKKQKQITTTGKRELSKQHPLGKQVLAKIPELFKVESPEEYVKIMGELFPTPELSNGVTSFKGRQATPNLPMTAVASSTVQGRAVLGDKLYVKFHSNPDKVYKYSMGSNEAAKGAFDEMVKGSPGRWVWNNLRGHKKGDKTKNPDGSKIASKYGKVFGNPSKETLGGIGASNVPYDKGSYNRVKRFMNEMPGFEELAKKMSKFKMEVKAEGDGATSGEPFSQKELGKFQEKMKNEVEVRKNLLESIREAMKGKGGLKDAKRTAESLPERDMTEDTEGGRWITVNGSGEGTGVHVFVNKGQSVKEALNEHFTKKEKKKRTKELEGEFKRIKKEGKVLKKEDRKREKAKRKRDLMEEIYDLEVQLINQGQDIEQIREEYEQWEN